MLVSRESIAVVVSVHEFLGGRLLQLLFASHVYNLPTVLIMRSRGQHFGLFLFFFLFEGGPVGWNGPRSGLFKYRRQHVWSLYSMLLPLLFRGQLMIDFLMLLLLFLTLQFSSNARA